jgi:hypothetical protein
MALDPSIFALFKPRSVADYQREQFDLENAQQGQQLNALQLLSGRRKMEQEDRAREEQNALARLMAGGFDRRAPDAQQRLYQTAPNLAPGVQKQWLEQDKGAAELAETGAKTKKVEGETAENAYKLARAKTQAIYDATSAATDPASYAMALRGLQASGIDVSQIQQQFDPAFVAQTRQQALTELQRLDVADKAAGRKQTATRDAQAAANDIMVPDGKGGFIPNRPLIGAKAAIAKAGASSVNVTATQEKEESKAVGKFLGEQYADIQKAGIGAQAKLDRAARMEQLLATINTGKFEGAKKEAAAIGQAFGITIDPNLGDKEAFEALSNQLALEARNPSGGAGMPGAMSDKDREFLQQITPNLTKTPEGNRKIIETAKKLAKRDADVARMSREYRKKSGTLDEGFFEELRQFSERTPLFGKPAAKPSSEVDEAMKKYGGG